MNVEDKAQQMIEDFLVWTNTPSEGKEELKARFVKHLRDQIEACAKLADDESIRLDSLGMGYKKRGDLVTATRYSACIVTAAKLGREIRALAGSIEQDDGPDNRFDLGGFECNEKQED